MATAAIVPAPPSDQAVSRTYKHRAGKEGLRPLGQCSGMSPETYAEPGAFRCTTSWPSSSLRGGSGIEDIATSFGLAEPRAEADVG
jgi:hypothetical protein